MSRPRKVIDPIQNAITAFNALDASQQITFMYVISNMPGGRFTNIPATTPPASFDDSTAGAMTAGTATSSSLGM